MTRTQAVQSTMSNSNINCKSARIKYKNSVSDDSVSMLNNIGILLDTPNLDKKTKNLSIMNELQKYDAPLYFSTVVKYGPFTKKTKKISNFKRDG
jgi:hypothetical protein